MAASALYACTKCTQRYPFEELSQGQQLCKVRGRWAAGGVSSARARGNWVSAALQPGSLRRRLGGLELFLASSTGTPLSEDVGIRWEGPLRGRQNSALFLSAQKGAGPPPTFRGLRGGAE